jgi:hypothetical protein
VQAEACAPLRVQPMARCWQNHGSPRIREDPRPRRPRPAPHPAAQAAFTAARDIAAGEQLTITYTDSSQGVAERRARL